MKTLFVVRHSKAEQSFMGSDFERNLTQQGKANTTLITTRFLQHQHTIDTIISSPANRAKMTAQLFAESLQISKQNILLKSELYNAEFETYYDVLQHLPNTITNVMLVAHNPAITYFINSMHIAQLDNMPTTGIFGVSIATSNWAEFYKAKKEFLYFDYPKK